jgi:hypothetical protein
LVIQKLCRKEKDANKEWENAKNMEQDAADDPLKWQPRRFGAYLPKCFTQKHFMRSQGASSTAQHPC